jgi:aspartyl-tRNA(Asn)/glutamyl-tRNA(Gln) amidotransferase subunit A
MIFSVSKRPTISQIHDLYRENKATVSEVSKFFLNRSQQTDKQINSFCKHSPEVAQVQSENLDLICKEYKDKYDKDYFDKLLADYPLFGIPFSIKNIILAEGEVFTASSKILDGFKAPYSATVYKKMENAGAVLIGINNMDQFAMGASGENSDYGVTKNPFDLSRIPGGSSSGPAASVASGQVVFSLGTDTGGSIRQPASFCDVVGLKPTYGLVSRYGVMPMASSLDQVGAFTNNVEDNVLLTKLLAGKDENDQTSIESSDLVLRLEKAIQQKKTQRKTKKLTQTNHPMKVGIPKEFYIDGIDPKIRAALDKLQKELKDIGHEIVPVSVPSIEHAISVYYLTMSVEVAANLERIDGVRYAPQQDSYSELYYEHRNKYFGDEPKRRIMLGTYASSAGYYDAYYNQAQKVRKLARNDFDKAFESCDIMLTPTSPEFPFKIGQKSNDPLSMYLSDVFTCGINPVRIPGLAVPMGLFDVEDEGKIVKLPAGCQLLGPEQSEDKLFKLAEEIETIINQEI